MTLLSKVLRLRHVFNKAIKIQAADIEIQAGHSHGIDSCAIKVN